MKGINPIDSLTKFNILYRTDETRLTEVTSSKTRVLGELADYLPFDEYLPGNFYSEEIHNSILFNGGGLVTAMLCMWAICLPAFLLRWIRNRKLASREKCPLPK